MGKKFKVVEYNDYYECLEVNIYTDGSEEPETEYLPAVFDPKFEAEVEEKDVFCDVFDEWVENGEEPIIGFRYGDEVVLLANL